MINWRNKFQSESDEDDEFEEESEELLLFLVFLGWFLDFSLLAEFESSDSDDSFDDSSSFALSHSKNLDISFKNLVLFSTPTDSSTSSKWSESSLSSCRLLVAVLLHYIIILSFITPYLNRH